MSDIPLISVTQEDLDYEISNGETNRNINEAHTDVEDLSDEETTTPGKKITFMEFIKPSSRKSSVTDVEECEASDNESSPVGPSPVPADFPMDEFLDQGYVNETFNVSGEKKKQIMKSSNLLVAASEAMDGVTDCEDCQTDDDEASKENDVPDCPEDFLVTQEMNAVDIHDAVVKRKTDKICKKRETPTSSDSESEVKIRHHFHRKCHKKENDKDEEQILLLSDEEGAKPKLPNIQITMDSTEPDEITMETSDVDEPLTFPEVNISFVTDSGDTGHKPPQKMKYNTLLPATREEEALTDVENLDSSTDESDQEEMGACRMLPKAVVAAGGLTDVEDFDGSEADISDAGPEFDLPPPVRELVILNEDQPGNPVAKTIPLSSDFHLGIPNLNEDAGTTDIEDENFSGDDEDEIYDSSKYTDFVPQLDEGGCVATKESTIAKKCSIQIDHNEEPTTDTEDMGFYNSVQMEGGCSNNPPNELRRRRKPKSATHTHSHSHTQSQHHHHHHHKGHKGKTALDASSPAPQSTTDVEDLLVSDEEEAKALRQRRATIEVASLSGNINEVKTDVEYLSGEEVENTCCTPDNLSRSPLPYFRQENCSTTTMTNDMTAGDRDHLYGNVPIIRRISPSPCSDMRNDVAHTDTEEFQGVSDADDENFMDSLSRAQTATPQEIRKQLDESGSSEIHEVFSGAFDLKKERGQMKGRVDGTENTTDIEYIEDDDGAQN